MKKNIYALFFLITCAGSKATYYSQSGQDRYLYTTFFKNKKSGFFVEIGAHDGVTYSNTLFFEKHLGWNGICIEPIPDIFKKLEKNRSCICIHGCITNKSGVAAFLKITGYSEMLSGLIENYDPRHLQRIEHELEKYGGSKEIIPVQCYVLNDLVEEYNIDHIDYLSIDTEGNELDILKSINFEKILIHIIGVENNYHEPHIRNLLESKGYQFVAKIGADEMYKKLK